MNGGVGVSLLGCDKGSLKLFMKHVCVKDYCLK